MKEIGMGVKKIWKEQRGVFLMMVATSVGGLILLIFSLASLNPSAAVTKVGYGDIGGYRDGSWQTMVMFPLFAILMMVLHNLIAVRIFNKSGGAMTMVFLGATLFLIVFAIVVLARLTGEG